MTREYYQVPVAEVVRETGDACSLVLDVPPALAVVFGYRSGQFVTVRVPSELCGSVARFEFEIDTARAVAGWETEVAANLAKAAGGSRGVVPPGDRAEGG